MTTSRRTWLPGQPRWDDSRPRIKSYEPFYEPGLFSILFLACGRPWVTRRALLSTAAALAHYPGEVEWILVENGGNPWNLLTFATFSAERKVIVTQANYGISQGFNQAWALARGEFCVVHENDWECRLRRDFLSPARDILNEFPDVGVVQLRAVHDPHQNWGWGKPLYSPWSCSVEANQAAGVTVRAACTRSGHAFAVADHPNGFNNNPNVVRKTLYRDCGPYPEAELGGDPTVGETQYQALVARTGCLTAHIGQELYYHLGRRRTRP